MMNNRSRYVKLLNLAECFRSRKKKLKKDNTPDTAKSEISYKGMDSLAAQVPITDVRIGD